jgi:hypothetical protein
LFWSCTMRFRERFTIAIWIQAAEKFISRTASSGVASVGLRRG